MRIEVWRAAVVTHSTLHGAVILRLIEMEAVQRR
jgi:hypothetical protein